MSVCYLAILQRLGNFHTHCNSAIKTHKANSHQGHEILQQVPLLGAQRIFSAFKNL
jgi:hypothetical protein